MNQRVLIWYESARDMNNCIIPMLRKKSCTRAKMGYYLLYDLVLIGIFFLSSEESLLMWMMNDQV